MSRWSYHTPILGYHRVGESRPDHVPTVSVWAFERHLAWLAKYRYRMLDLGAIAQAIEQGAPLPRRSAVITFDDGYEETCTIAWPLLKRFGFPATVFVTADEVGRPGFASWDQLRQAAAEGLAVGSHTMSHSYLPAVSPERQPEELIESKRVIEARLGCPIAYLSYPVGGFTPQAQQIARQAGYRAAVTTNRAAGNGPDLFALRRVKMTERDAHSPLLFVKLSGYYDAFRKLRAPS